MSPAMTNGGRIVCHCFRHTLDDLLAAREPGGGNAIIRSITEACQAGRDRCAELNPSGHCCLGAIRRILKEQADDPGSSGDCCS
jgi:hypothetical protein